MQIFSRDTERTLYTEQVVGSTIGSILDGMNYHPLMHGSLVSGHTRMNVQEKTPKIKPRAAVPRA